MDVLAYNCAHVYFMHVIALPLAEFLTPVDCVSVCIYNTRVCVCVCACVFVFVCVFMCVYTGGA